MADTLNLNDVSTKDTGKGSKLETGGRREHNMPKACVDRLMKAGKSRSEAEKQCYSGMKTSTQEPIQTKQEESDLMGLPAAQNARTIRRNKRNASKKY